MTPEQKLEICTWLYNQELEIQAASLAWGKLEGHTQGKITRPPRDCSGVWGYEGDSIAIYINDNPYPSCVVARLNKNLLPAEYQLLVTQYEQRYPSY